MARVVQRKRQAEAVATGRFHTDMGPLAVHGLEPNQDLLPAIGIVGELPGLLSLAARVVRIQGRLGHVDAKSRVVHLAAIVAGEHGKAPRRATLYAESAAGRVPGYRSA